MNESIRTPALGEPYCPAIGCARAVHEGQHMTPDDLARHKNRLAYDELSDQRSLLILALIGARDELRDAGRWQIAGEIEEVLQSVKVRE